MNAFNSIKIENRYLRIIIQMMEFFVSRRELRNACLLIEEFSSCTPLNQDRDFKAFLLELTSNRYDEEIHNAVQSVKVDIDWKDDEMKSYILDFPDHNLAHLKVSIYFLAIYTSNDRQFLKSYVLDLLKDVDVELDTYSKNVLSEYSRGLSPPYND